MKRNIRIFSFVIFISLISSGIMYSQTNFWERSSSLGGGEVITVTNSGDIWNTNVFGGLRLSTNNGDNWIQKNSVPFVIYVESITVSPVNGYIFLTSLFGLWRSTDTGENLLQVTDSIYLSNTFITPSGEIYTTLKSGGAVYYSSDNGDTWVDKSNGLPSNIVIESLILGKDGTLYAGGANQYGVYRSTNGGDTWLPPSNYTNTSIKDLTISDDGTIFAAALNNALLKSTDKGITWNQVMEFNFGTPWRICYNTVTKDLFVYCQIIFGRYYELYRSTDLGANWELKHDGLPDDDYISTLTFNPNTGQMFAVCTGVLYRSTDIIYPPTNNFWERTNLPLPLVYGCVIAVTNNGDIWAASNGDTERIWLSTDNGDTWVQKNSVTGPVGPGFFSITISPVNGYLFFSSYLQGLFRSTDNGENWLRVTDSVFIIHTFITPSGEIYIIPLSGGAIYYSSNNGDTWVDKSNGLPSDISIRSLILGKDGTLYAGGTNQYGVYRSTNGGDTWLPPSNYTNISISDLTISDDGTIFASSDSGLLKSTDKGVTWNQIMEFDFGTPVAILYNTVTKDIFVNCRTTIFVGNSQRLYRSTDLGANWELKHDGLPNNGSIGKPTFNPNTGQMFATSVIIGVDYQVYQYFYRSKVQAIYVEEPKEIPTTYSLSQNYPNPFNPTTTIQYSIPKDEFVKLTVYDITGRVVKELVSDYKVAGKYSVEFNATGLASGVYFYKLNTSGKPLINRMMLIK